MRRFLMGAAFVCCAMACGQEPGRATPVPNAGIEDGQDAPDHWSWRTGEGSGGEFTWETRIAHGGGKSARVRKIGSAGHTLLVGDLVPVEPGKTYRVSAWVYPAKHLRGGVYFMISQYLPDTEEWQLPNTFGRTAEPLIGGRWQQLAVRVEMREGNTRLRIQCVQAFGTSDVCWDDFEVTEAEAEPPPRYEPPTAEPLPDLEAAKQIVARRSRARAEVVQREGRPRLIVDGNPTPWAFYVGPFWNPKDAQIADFRNAGVRVYLVPLVLGRQVYGDRGPWRGKGEYDFSEVDELLWRVLRVDPEGYVIFYMACDPYREWGAENPDHVTQDQNAQKAIVTMHPKRWGDDPKAPERFGPSLVSLKLREDISATLRRLVAHVEESEAGKAVIGYHVAGLNDGQWFQWARLTESDLHLADYCPGAQESFRRWLKRRYGGDVRALRQAWNRPGVSFETAEVPPFERYWADATILDSATQQDIADHTRFYSEGVAETVMALAGVLKQATPRPIICGTYYEDITCNSANHIALGRFLDSENLDYFSGPAAYSIRMAGHQGAVRSVFGSVLLHGKMYLTEQDWRSWHSHPSTPANNFAWGRAQTADIHNAMVRRESGMMLAFGLGTWWYDMSGGWFRDDQIMAGIAEARRAFDRDLHVGGPPRADLAVFVSEQSNDYIAPKAAGRYRHLAIRQQIEEFNTAGVPYRVYLQSDLGRPDMPAHNAYLFLNPCFLSEPQKTAIEHLKRDGNLLVFVHAPGIVGAQDPASAIRSLTGIQVRAAEGVTGLASAGIEGDHPLLRGLDGCLTKPTRIQGPAYEVVDESAAPLAHHVGTDSVAIAARDFGDWKSVFVGCPSLTAPFLHNLAQWAGCWCAAEPGDAVYANERFITIHAIFPGHKRLRLARPSRVTDLTTGSLIAERAETLELDMERAETRWFALDPPE